MRWFKGDLRKSDVIIIGVMLLLVLLIVVFALLGRGPQTAQPAQATGTIAIETAKEQLIKLQHDNDRSLNAWFWNSGAAIFSTLVIVIGGLFGLWRWRVERQDAQAKELEDRQAERERRDDDRLQDTIAGLGSERIEARAIAASMLLTFLQQPGYERFHQQIFNLAVTNLQLHHVDPSTRGRLEPLRQALITVFKDSFPPARKALIGQEEPHYKKLGALDASHVKLGKAFLRYADLKGIFMREADLSGTNLRKADLSNAALTHTDLSDAYLHYVNLSGARLRHAVLSRAHLKGADLRGAYLASAELDEANLYKADLRGADLRDADLSDADLRGADLSDADLDGAILQGAKYNTKKIQEKDGQGKLVTIEPTQWPQKFNPSDKKLGLICVDKDATIDEAHTTSPSQSPVSPPVPSQSNDAQAPSAPPAQQSTPSPDPDGSRAASSQPSAES
jgi:uncharacterized protein YjbI with pentapeptide repeats